MQLDDQLCKSDVKRNFAVCSENVSMERTFKCWEFLVRGRVVAPVVAGMQAFITTKASHIPTPTSPCTCNNEAGKVTQ
eukprot:3439049-Amphidinium_carterae.2